MNILDLSRVTWTITRLDITARSEDTRFLHRWIIGEEPPFIGGGRLFWDIAAGRVSDINRKINVHGDRKANGQPEMGWGLNCEVLPLELVGAEITNLGMRCSDGITYTVFADVVMSPMLADMLTQEMSVWEREKDGDEDVPESGDSDVRRR